MRFFSATTVATFVLLFLMGVYASICTAFPGTGRLYSSGSIQLVASTIANNSGSALTTSAINTTGSTLIVLAECSFSTTTPTPTDSKSNTWHALTFYGNGSNDTGINIYYAYAPTTSTSHTFTDSNTGSGYVSIAVMAFSGTLATSSVYDTSNGLETDGSQSGHTGSVTPSELNELATTFTCSGETAATTGSINDSFTMVQYLSGNSHGSDAQDMAFGYWIATSLSAVNPTWTLTGDTNGITSAIATFKHP